MTADPVSDAMWADLHAAEQADVQASDAIVILMFGSPRRAWCRCPRCLAAAYARAGCDGCADLAYGPCADHKAAK